MKTVILAAALGTLLMSFPAPAQERSGTLPDRGRAPEIERDTTPGTRTLGEPGERVRPDRDRSRTFDRQRDASPMTSDPRLGPGGVSGPTNRSPGSGGSTGTGTGTSGGSLGGGSGGGSSGSSGSGGGR